MCAVGYDGDGVKECVMKPGWEAVLKAPTPSSAVGPDGMPVLVDNQAQRDLRAKLEEESIKAQFASRERDRTRRIQELQTRIMEYEEMRRHRKVSEDSAAVRRLERRVNQVEQTSVEIASQKQQQLKLLQELKTFEESQEAALKDLVREKSDLVLEKAKEEARRLAALARRRSAFPPLEPSDPSITAAQNQNYVDPSRLPRGTPLSNRDAATRSTASAPVVAGNADLSKGDPSHRSGAEAAAAGAVTAELH
jgi:vacuolar-type H+-ATPase subunit I/STV1